MRFLLFIFGFFLYIYLEISLLVTVGSNLGVLPMICLMLAISAFGLWLLKIRGVFTVWQIKKQIGEGKIPTQALSSSILFLIAGILLIIPGFISDILALLALLPFTRNLIEKLAMRFIADKVKFFSFGSANYTSHTQGTTFEAEFERKADEDKRLK